MSRNDPVELNAERILSALTGKEMPQNVRPLSWVLSDIADLLEANAEAVRMAVSGPVLSVQGTIETMTTTLKPKRASSSNKNNPVEKPVEKLAEGPAEVVVEDGEINSTSDEVAAADENQPGPDSEESK